MWVSEAANWIASGTLRARPTTYMAEHDVHTRTQGCGQRRALLIGSAVGGLSGVSNDLEAMSELLDRRGFEVLRCEGPAATRARMLAMLRSLADGVVSGDAVVIYYSGHGGLARFHDDERANTWAYLVPVEGSRIGEQFNGVLDLEVSEIVDQIDARCGNVTLILDCCHSGDIGRVDEDLTQSGTERIRSVAPKLFARPSWLAQVLERLARGGQRLAAESHPRVVRALATSSDTWAFESPRSDGSYEGVFTAALVAELAASDEARLSWDRVMRRVRERVFARRGSETQRPELSGPGARIPFETLEQRSASVATLMLGAGQRERVRAGWLHGWGVHDRVVVGESPRDERHGELVLVHADIAELQLEPGVVAQSGAPVRLVRSHSPLPVTVSGPHAGSLGERLARSPWLEVAHGGPATLELRSDADALELCDEHGPLRVSIAADEHGMSNAIRDLEAIARAAKFEAASRRAPGLGDPSICWELTLHVETSSGSDVVPATGATLHVEDRIWLELRNNSPRGTQRLFISVVDLGIARRAQLLNQSQPAGIPLSPGGIRQLGRRPGAPVGLTLAWPREVPRDRPRREQIVIVVGYRPVDLRLLEPCWIHNGEQSREVERTLSLTADPSEPRWEARRIEFDLDPTPRVGG